MFISLPLMALGALASAKTGLGLDFNVNLADVTSYDSFVDMVPECTQPCFDQLFDDYLAPGCGDVRSSVKKGDIACICTTGSDEDAANASEFLATCMENKCGGSVDEGDLVDPSKELVEWCKKVPQEE